MHTIPRPNRLRTPPPLEYRLHRLGHHHLALLLWYNKLCRVLCYVHRRLTSVLRLDSRVAERGVWHLVNLLPRYHQSVSDFLLGASYRIRTVSCLAWQLA